MDSWTPPKTGSPCWVQIVATDVGRAKEFYRTVFSWDFKPPQPNYPEDKLAMFSFPDEKFKHLSGGICNAEGDLTVQSKHSNILYLYVHDIEEMITKVTEAGGKAIGEKEAEGTSGWMQHFADTEGNYCGMYTVRKDK